MKLLATLQLLLSAGLAFAVLGGLAASALVPLAVSRTSGWAPERRQRLLALLCLFPALLGLSAWIAALSQSLLALIWPEYDHCLVHNDRHVHICLFHPPEHLGNWPSCAFLLAGLLWILSRLCRAGRELYAGRRWSSRLFEHADRERAIGALVLPVAAPLCLLVGVFQPVIVLSRGLLAKLNEDDLRVILAHEHSHATHRDVLFRLLARATTLFMLPGARRTLLDILELSSEQRCDDAAALQVGDRLKVAETILKVARLISDMPGRRNALAVSFGGERVGERVGALLEPQRRLGNAFLSMSGFALCCCGLIAASRYVHHYTESLLAALTR